MYVHVTLGHFDGAIRAEARCEPDTGRAHVRAWLGNDVFLSFSPAEARILAERLTAEAGRAEGAAASWVAAHSAALVGEGAE